MRELDDGEGRGHAETWGRASGNGQVYQSGANQYVTHIHIAEARSQTAHEARQRADGWVQLLTRAVGEWTARCEELEEQVKRARAEGRAEAQAEFAKRLQDAELRVMRAQSTMRQAEEERAKAEALLAQAQEELARRRREAERDARREREAAPFYTPPGLSQDEQDAEQFSDLMERAEAELGAVREELRQLGEEIGGQDGGRTEPQVIEGEWVRRSTAAEEVVPVEPVVFSPRGAATPADPATKATAKPERTPVPGPPRRFLIGVTWSVCALTPWVPMLVVTTVRAMLASDASLVKVVPFTALTVLVGVLLFAVMLALAAFTTMDMLNRDSEQSAGGLGCLVVVAGSLLLLGAAFLTPLSWPGPAGAWGRGLASGMGLG